METNDHLLIDYSAILEAEFGKPGTPERAKFDEEAYLLYEPSITRRAKKKSKKKRHGKNNQRTI